jgi:hypothetical protein
MTKSAALTIALTLAFVFLASVPVSVQAKSFPPPPPPYACQDSSSGWGGAYAACSIECYHGGGGSVSVISGALGTLPAVHGENQCGPEIECDSFGLPGFLDVPSCFNTGTEDQPDYSFAICKGNGHNSLGYVNVALQCTTSEKVSPESMSPTASLGTVWNIAEPGFTGSSIRAGDMVCVPFSEAEIAMPSHCFSMTGTTVLAVTGLAAWTPVGVACAEGSCHDVDWIE